MASLIQSFQNAVTWLVQLFWDLAAFTPKDQAIGQICSKASPAELQRLFLGKRALVVGGTKGIGSGIAVALAEAGASVHLVGRDKAAAAQILGRMQIGKMSMNVPMSGSDFQFTAADLASVQGCIQLVETIAERKEKCKFDAVVMTVGAWPDLTNPLTKDGYNRVLFLDVLAKFIIFTKLHERGMLAEGAAVMSVCASGQELPLARLAKPYLKNLIMSSGGKAGADPLFLRTLVSAGVSADAFLLMASKAHKTYKFIGTFPGLVATDVMVSTFGRFISNLGKKVLNMLALFNISMSEQECGVNHMNILAQVFQNDFPVTFWDHFLQARTASTLASDDEFQKWVWNLGSTVLKTGS